MKKRTINKSFKICGKYFHDNKNNCLLLKQSTVNSGIVFRSIEIDISDDNIPFFDNRSYEFIKFFFSISIKKQYDYKYFIKIKNHIKILNEDNLILIKPFSGFRISPFIYKKKKMHNSILNNVKNKAYIKNIFYLNRVSYNNFSKKYYDFNHNKLLIYNIEKICSYLILLDNNMIYDFIFYNSNYNIIKNFLSYLLLDKKSFEFVYFKKDINKFIKYLK